MLSFSLVKDAVVAIGAPATFIGVTIAVFELGWMPFATVNSRVLDQTMAIEKQTEQSVKSLIDVQQQHLDHMKHAEIETKALLDSLVEVCMNTARTEARLRACAGLAHH